MKAAFYVRKMAGGPGKKIFPVRPLFFVEKIVDYFRKVGVKTPFSPLANPTRLLLDRANPYLSDRSLQS
jgi:hypothetical protein